MFRATFPAVWILAACADSDLAGFEVVADLPDGRMDHPYQGALSAEGASGAVTFEIVDGALPPGLDLDPDGDVTGTPEAWGTFSFSVTAWDPLDAITVDLSLEVLPVVLVSGFEPFGDFDLNTSWESIVPLENEVIAGLDVRVALLPVEWNAAWSTLEPEIEAYDPIATLGTGQAGWHAMRFETTARNQQEGTDEAGIERNGEEVVPGGPATLSSALPIEEMRTAMERAGHTVRVSDNAGTYLCNDIFYHLETDGLASGRVTGFLHVPPPDSEAFPIAEVTAAHRVGLEALALFLASEVARRIPSVDLHATPSYVRSQDVP